jgi:hypothetical protein
MTLEIVKVHVWELVMVVVKGIVQHLAQEPHHQHVEVRVQARHLQIAETAVAEHVQVVVAPLVQELVAVLVGQIVQVVVLLLVVEVAIQHVIPLVPVLVAAGAPPIVREVVPEPPKLLAVLVRLLATLLAPHNV